MNTLCPILSKICTHVNCHKVLAKFDYRGDHLFTGVMALVLFKFFFSWNYLLFYCCSWNETSYMKQAWWEDFACTKISITWATSILSDSPFSHCSVDNFHSTNSTAMKFHVWKKIIRDLLLLMKWNLFLWLVGLRNLSDPFPLVQLLW